MRNILIPLLIVVLLGCQDTFNDNDWTCDCEGVEVEVQQFVNAAPDWVNWKPLRIELVDTIISNNPRAVVGLTIHADGLILLDTTSGKWILDRQALVWHELGHYLLNREHDNEMIEVDGQSIPKSVMHYNQWILIDRQPQSLKDYYLDELFGRPSAYNEIELELTPEVFYYAPDILDLNLPNELLEKTAIDDHAKFVSDNWSDFQNQVMFTNESIARILYEIDIATVLDTTIWPGSSTWLPINAESKDLNGFLWKTSNYDAKFYRGEADVTEVGVDDNNRYINWYYLNGDLVGGIEQTLDGESGFGFSEYWHGDRGGPIHDYRKTSWESQDDKLIYKITQSREYRNFEEFNIIWSGELRTNGSGFLFNNDDCVDRYLWDEEGNGVYEKREMNRSQDDCTLEIVEW